MMIQGLFGGTFNPLHQGHLAVILHVKEAFNLDTIHLIPSAIPPHKPASNLAPAADRFEMVKRSIANIPGLVVSDVEIHRRGPSFTIDTVQDFINNTPLATELRLIVGSDAFFEMDTWKRGRTLFSLIPTIVMIRPGEEKQAKDVASFLQDVISNNYRPVDGERSFSAPISSDFISGSDSKSGSRSGSKSGVKPVYICKVPEIDISSTLIRRRIKLHLPVATLVPKPVEEIITQRGLYL
jgi:nicotinate-nucleotide adenylyltransferase